MVVSRRNPVVPPPVASRTNSSQALPRKQKQPSAPSPLVDEKTTKAQPLRPRRTKPRAKRHPRTLSFLDRLFLFSLFGFVAYAATVCSSPWTSPHKIQVPYHEQPLACRALITYRTAFLEPYVLPPLQLAYKHTLGHPTVQAQYVSHVQPHLSTIKEHSRPVVNVALQVNDRFVKPTIDLVHGKVWMSYVVPWYYRAYLPRYRMYVAPRLRAGWEHGVKAPLEPYTKLVQKYARDAQLYVHKHLIHRVKAWYHDAVDPIYASIYPKVVQTYASIRPEVVQTYKTLEPALCTVYGKGKAGVQTVWVYAEPHLCNGWNATRVYLGVAVTEAGKARRTYVDPHVRRILERVRVSGDGSSSVSAGASSVGGEEDVVFDEQPSPTSESVPEPTTTEFAEQIWEEKVLDIPVTPEHTAEDVTPPTASPTEGVMDEASVATPTATPTPVPSSHTVEEEEEELRRVVSVAEQSAAGHESSTGQVQDPEPSGPAKDAEEGVAEAMANSFVRRIKMLEEMERQRVAAEEAAREAGEITPSAVPTATASLEVPPHSTAVAEEEVELDDFLSDLGIDSSPFDLTPEKHGDEEATQVPQDAYDSEVDFKSDKPQISEEERLEAAKVATAEKRAKILARHAVWQKKMEDLVEVQMGRVIEGIEGVRAWGVSELGDEYVDAATAKAAAGGGAYKKKERVEGEQGLGKKAMGGVEKQGQRLFTGLESYIKKAIARSASWKVVQSDTGAEIAAKAKKATEENDKWDEVVGKVDERFNSVVKGVQGEVHEWYKGMKGREIDAATEAALTVKNLAEGAQADLAMSYAWLEDVTYQDWQTYHELMRIYERFEQTALAIQAGSYVADASTPKLYRPLSSPDPLVKALDKLQSELDDIVLGFQLTIGGLNKKATKVFSTRVYRTYNTEASEEDEEGFFAVKRGKGELVDDMRGEPGYAASGKDESSSPPVSILPIESPPAPKGDDDDAVRDAASILLGKGAQQVEEAIARASALGEGVRSNHHVAKSEEEL